MDKPDLTWAATRTLSREATFLDLKQWDSWLHMYSPEATFWVPTWLNEDDITSDPETQLSLIYLDGQAAFKERVMRAKDPRSPAGLPLPRTTHVLGPVQLVGVDGTKAWCRCAWSSFVYDLKSRRTTNYAGQYEYELLCSDSADPMINAKKVVLMNDAIESKLDFFYI